MTMYAVYFIGSLVALTAAMAFFLKGVLVRKQYEDEEWRERIGDRR